MSEGNYEVSADILTDYETYREIMDELLAPIAGSGLDPDTLQRLYASKLVYLENLRLKCFVELNSRHSLGHFSSKDYEVIIRAIRETHNHLHDLVLFAVSCALSRRKKY